MRNIMMAAAASALLLGSVAMADEFNGQNATQTRECLNAYPDQQATGGHLSDPTAPDCTRSQGYP